MLRRHPVPRRALWLLALLPWLGLLPAADLDVARADLSAEARTPAEIYERKGTIHECLVYVAKDLKARWEARPDQPPAVLLLVVDPTTSLKAEIGQLGTGLEKAWAAGPKGMRIGVYGLEAEEYAPPSRIPTGAQGALSSLAYLPVDGPSNLHRGIREAADLMRREPGGPKAMLLVTEEGGESEDDVEATREAIFDAGAAFYCIAGEAAFERAWLQTFEPRWGYAAAGLEERQTPMPRKKVKDSLFHGGEVAFGLVPHRWELDLAQAEFVWVRPPRYPVPAGFGYWGLATLCFTSGGRYFVFDFAAAQLSKRGNARRTSLYEFSRMAHLAPDLRPRSRILKDLNRDWRAQALVRIWQHLSDEATPVIQTIGNLERRGGALQVRPARPVRSSTNPRAWYTDLDDVRDAIRQVQSRIKVVDQALQWWSTANGRERTEKTGEDPLKERIEADFQLLGVQLRKVRFHWYEALAALESIRQLDVTYREARIVPRGIMAGLRLPPRKVDLGDEERNARFAEVVLATQRMARKYTGTPWALTLEKGFLLTFDKNVRILEPEPERPGRPDRPTRPGRGDGKPKEEPKPPPKPPKPPTPPKPGPKPGSGSGGPVTGK